MSRNQKILLLIFLIGLCIRLLLMPLAMQADLLSMSYRAQLMSEHGLWGLPTNQTFAHYIYAANLLLIKPFFTDLTGFFGSNFGVSVNSMTSSVGDWLNFITQTQVNAFIFALKIPHLLADILIFYLLASFFRTHPRKLTLVALWWFNPVNLYAFYVFARHDSLTLLALLLTFIFAARSRLIASLLSLFAAIQIRFQPLLYLPIVLIYFYKRIAWPQFILQGFMVTLIIGTILGIQGHLPFDQALYARIKTLPETRINQTAPASLQQTVLSTLSKPFAIAQSVGGRSTLPKLSIFSVAIIFVLIAYLRLPQQAIRQAAFLELNVVSYSILTLYFLINDFSPHYFVWLSLFAVGNISLHRTFIWSYLLSVLGWGMMGIFATGNFAINQYLLLPISPLLFATPQIGLSFANAPLLFNLGLWLLRLGLLWSLWLIFLSYRRQLQPPHSSSKRNGSIVGIMIFVFLLTSWLIKPPMAQAVQIPLYSEISGEDKIQLQVNQPHNITIITPQEELGIIELQFDTSRNQEAKRLRFRLREEGSQAWLYEAVYNVADFYNQAFYPFGFPPVFGQNKALVIEVTLLDEGSATLYWYPQRYRLAYDGSWEEFLVLLKLDLQSKWQAQQKFWLFWVGLLTTNLLAIFVLLVSMLKNKKSA